MKITRPILAALLISMPLGCVDVQGGAVEIRWDLQYGGTECRLATEGEARCVPGRRTSCALSMIGYVGLRLEALDGRVDPCSADPERCRFPCERKVGTTTFFIPEGEHAISLQAQDLSGAVLGPATGVNVPAPVVRQVRSGELVDLDVNLIVVERCEGC